MQNILVVLKKVGLLVLICLILSPLFPYQETEAFIGNYFGGKISYMVPCTCNTDGSSQITIIGPTGSIGTYLYTPTVKTYAKNSVKLNSFLLGKYSSGGSCLVGVLPECTTLPITKGTLNYIGTSF